MQVCRSDYFIASDPTFFLHDRTISCTQISLISSTLHFRTVDGATARNPSLDVNVESQPNANSAGKFHSRRGFCWGEGAGSRRTKNTFCFSCWNVNGGSDVAGWWLVCSSVVRSGFRRANMSTLYLFVLLRRVVFSIMIRGVLLNVIVVVGMFFGRVWRTYALWWDDADSLTTEAGNLWVVVRLSPQLWPAAKHHVVLLHCISSCRCDCTGLSSEVHKEEVQKHF